MRAQVFFARSAAPASLFLAGLAAGAADVSYYGVIKSQQYQQTVSSGPSLLATNPYAFNAFVVASTNYAVTNATVKPPGTTPLRTLTPDTNGVSLQFEERFSSATALDAAYPSGTFSSYAFTIYGTNDGLVNCSASFFGAGTPTTPQINNLAAAQQIHTPADFTLTWNPLGGSSLDIVQVVIMDSGSNVVFNSPVPFSTNALNGTSTSVVIPANTLPSGAALVGHLTYARPGLPSTTYGTGICANARDTEFPLATLAAIPPTLHVFAAGPPFTLSYTGETNRTYLLQGSTNLSDWVDLVITNAPTQSGFATDTNSGAFSKRFYRLKVVP